MSSKRIAKFDLIRMVAILSVVACHAVEKVYPFHEEVFHNYGKSSQLFALIVFSLGRVGVPLFFMLTGYFLLPRNYSDERATFSFYKTKVLQLYISIVIGIVGLSVADNIIDNTTIDWIRIIK